MTGRAGAVRARRDARAARRAAARTAAVTGEVRDLMLRGTVRPFVAPPCARCGARLCDSHGNPRWEIVGQLTFVCLGGCPLPVVRREAARRRAALS